MTATSIPIQLSVVIPAYNAAAYIAECLQSVLSQQDCPPFEVIVVDDGSKDGTAELVERDFSTVRLIRKPNGGPGSARNMGVEHAEADIIVFIDADDRMLPERLAFQGRFMLDNPRFGLTFGNQHYQRKPDYDANHHRGICESLDFSELTNGYARLLMNGNFVANTACAVRWEAYRSIGGQPEDIFVGEDYAMNCAIARQWPIAASRRYLTWYREGHGGNLMKSQHTYRGPVAVLRDELLTHGQCLTPSEYRQAFKRWRQITNMLLRWVWAESGHTAVVAEMSRLRPLLPPMLYAKWFLLSMLPSSLGRSARNIKRLTIGAWSRGRVGA
ncbi:putative glycosyltransferase EpsJ [Thiorhodovibrio winogradskyi]|uniref:Glycosyltransferase EpsJ n=1 Tax=Thiorhodovibrio winogradskyi TaxID=77007 RepID=A0ABZ0SEN6_9GAMM|nr:glycosyltransferase family 2 protein [Thiorhodovibrio winogradskyi]